MGGVLARAKLQIPHFVRDDKGKSSGMTRVKVRDDEGYEGDDNRYGVAHSSQKMA